jgi:hypothetical protein
MEKNNKRLEFHFKLRTKNVGKSLDLSLWRIMKELCVMTYALPLIITTTIVVLVFVFVVAITT